MAEGTGAEVDPAWEYTHISAPSNRYVQLVEKLNDLGSEGWRLVSTDAVDPPLGINTFLAVLRRRIEPLDPPAETSEGWYPDPSGRFDQRYWNGRAWTFHVGRAADKSTHRDPPTRRVPTPELKQ